MYKIVLIVLSVAVILAVFAPAAQAVEWWPLVPCGINPPDSVTPGHQPCNKCDLYKLLKNIIDFILFGLVPVGGTFFVVWAGFLILLGGANPSLQAKGMSMLKNVFYGIIWVAFSWLIVTSLLRTVMKDDNKAVEWWKITCTTTAEVITPTPVPGGLSESDARAQLAAAGVTVNASPPQTMLAGIQQKTLDEIIRLKQSCGCSVMVTGGTEPGHSEKHSQGLKFDLHLDSMLDAYIYLTYPYISLRGDGAKMYQGPGGVVYALEVDHWDVEVP